MSSGYSVVLGGGGAKGGYEIGVWKALKELNIPVLAVAGASVGALNGAMMVQGDLDVAEKMWTSMTMESVINMEKEVSAVGENKSRQGMLINTIRDIIISGGLDVSPLKQMLREVIDEKKIRESKIEFGLVTFSLTDFKPVRLFKEDIPEGKMVDYLLASACFPAFKRQEIDNKKFIDGGIYDNMPISLMVDKNIKNIISVDISGLGRYKKVDKKGLNICYIKNSGDLGGTLNFDGKRSEVNIRMGYYDTLRAFNKIDGKKYYFIPMSEAEKNRTKEYYNLNIEDLKKLYDFLGMKWGVQSSPTNKLIFNKVMRTIRSYSNEKLGWDTIIPAMAEITAEQMNIDRMKVYSLNELIDDILSEYQRIKNYSGFDEYMEKIRSVVKVKTQIEFNRSIKDLLIEGKFLIYYNPDMNERDANVKRFRRFMALTFTRTAIANMFISLLLSRKPMLKG